MKNSVAIMDLGTSKITVVIGSRGINNSICVDGLGICDYMGFSGGEWIDPEHLGSAIEQTIASAESSARVKINKLYIGVPGDFLLCKVNEVSMSLGKKRRVLPGDVEGLHNQGNDYFNDPDWKVINIQPIYYTLDDDRKLIAPEGMTSTRLGGCLSYILARREFISLIDAAVYNAGVSETEYVSSPLAEALFLFDDYKRDNCVLLADVGALGTTLSLARGDGICRQYYFGWGGERITAALSEKLDIPVQVAQALKRKVVLSLDPSYTPPKDEPGIVQTEYFVEIDNYTYPPFNVAEVNEIVEAEISVFARYVEKALKQCDYEYPDFLPLSVTGGGLLFRGATEFLRMCLGRDVETVKPQLPLFDRPQLSSALGLMDMVLSSEGQYVGVIGKIKRWFNRRSMAVNKE